MTAKCQLVSTMVQEFVDFFLGNMFTLDSWLEKPYARVIFEDTMSKSSFGDMNLSKFCTIQLVNM